MPRRVHDGSIPELLKRSPREIFEHLCTHVGPLFVQSMLVRKSLFERVGNYDERCLADDWVLTIRFFRELAKRGGHFAYLDEDVFAYRVHDGGVHNRFLRQSALKLEVMWRYTPWRLKRGGFANMFFDIGLHAAALRRNRLARTLFATAQLLQFDAGRRDVFKLHLHA